MPGEQPFSEMEATLKKCVAAFREAGVPFLLGGSLAIWARGGPETRHDLDFIVKPGDRERVLEVLADAGMKPERPPEEWLYKARDGDVLVDIIFGPAGLEVTDEVIQRGDVLHVLAISVPVMSIEDVIATKLRAMHEHYVDYSSTLLVARAVREQVDWPALRERTQGSPFADAFFTLVQALGIVDPDVTVDPREPQAARAAEARGAEVRVLTRPDPAA